MISRIHRSLQEREEGFTLIELLVVVIIIGILAAIAIPVFLQQRNKANDAAAKSDLRNLATAEESYLTSNPTGYSATMSDLTNNGLKRTTGVLLGVQVDGAKGYCAVAKSISGNYFLYDSQNGGLSTTVYTTAPTACSDSSITIPAPS